MNSPHVVVVGAGNGGVSLAALPRRRGCAVMLMLTWWVDRYVLLQVYWHAILRGRA